MSRLFLHKFKDSLDSQIQIQEVDHHINDPEFGEIAAKTMDVMVREK